MSMDNFLEDLLNQLIDSATALKDNKNGDFEKGQMLAYYEIISKILNQAEAFGIGEKLPAKLRDFNVESLLHDLD